MDGGGLLGGKVVGWWLCAKMIAGLVLSAGVFESWMFGTIRLWTFLKNV